MMPMLLLMMMMKRRRGWKRRGLGREFEDLGTGRVTAMLADSSEDGET